jgi:large subunit ribosomal protein L2
MVNKMKKFIIYRIKKKLTIGFSKRAGRNFFGRKTIFTQGGGVFVKLRVIDFKRILHCNGLLLSIEKDINRTGHIGLICYENGLYTYILLPLNYVNIGSYIYGFKNIFAMNYSTFLFNIPSGNFVHHIETIPGNGAILTRAAGSSSFIISNEDLNVVLKMNSG